MKTKDINGKLLYPNHYQMKKNRLIKLQQTKRRCEICQRQANTIHHKDGTLDNHSLDNLIVLCQSCHSIIHIPRGASNGHSTKFIREYGLTIKELAKKYKVCVSTIWKWHKNGRFKERFNFT